MSPIPLHHHHHPHPKCILLVALALLSPLSPAATPASAGWRRLSYPCATPHSTAHPFCNTSLPIPTRARSLLSLLSLPEKILQLSNTAAAVPRLGIPAYEWWSESLHGIATNGPGVSFNGSIPSATGFPQVILTAASFNRTLWRSLASAIAVEARAMYNAGQAGLTFWAPNINVFRDPRWGRGQETPGEDPTVAAAYSVEYVKGFQGEYTDAASAAADDTGNPMMLSACCKHFTAYDLEKWHNFSRYTFNAQVSLQDLEETYQPPFKSCIQEGNASCLMCSYNQVNGVPACAHRDFIDMVRKEWGFKGYITSDCDAVAIIFEDQRYANSPEDAVADVLKAGMDINCGTYLLRHTERAVSLGKVDEEDIDRALFNLFSVQLRLGLYNGDPASQQFGGFGPRNVCTKEHRELAMEAARQGFVLLKNDNAFLPLKKVSSLAIIGPAANDAKILGGDYTGFSCNPKSLFEGLRDYVQKTTFAAGCIDVPCVSDKGFNEAIGVTKEAEMVVVVAGLNLTEETEDHDRVSLLLPGKQMDLVNAVAGISKKPLILVLVGGGPIDVSFAKNNPAIASILWIGYPGEIGGKVLAEALFGKFNPGGRLPVTWYPESFTNVPMNDMAMRPDPARGYPGRTYRFYTGEVVYGFGHGMSYSNYSYKFSSVPDKISLSSLSPVTTIDRNPPYERKDGLDCIHIDDISSCEALIFHVQISVVNNGGMDGSHAVLLFSRLRERTRGSPQKQLVGFERVYTTASEATETRILVDPCKHMSTVNDEGKRILPLGAHVLMVDDIEHVLSIEI